MAAPNHLAPLTGRVMDYGVHLPLIGFDQRPFTLDRLLEYTRVAQDLGFRAIAANDHLVFARPWPPSFPIPRTWT